MNQAKQELTMPIMHPHHCGNTKMTRLAALEVLGSRQHLAGDPLTIKDLQTQVDDPSTQYVVSASPISRATIMLSDYSDAAADTVITPQPVQIPDQGLLSALRSALAKPTGDITDVDLMGLTWLSTPNAQILNLTGLQYATNLTSLYIEGNQITDIRPLSGLTKLTTLLLSNNQITDVTPLSSLTKLTFLDLYGNQITDITALSSLTNLRGLDLWWNQIIDVTPLSGLKNLTYVALGWNHITDITPLSGLKNLTYVSLGWNHITDVTPLSSLTKRTCLDLGGNQIAKSSL